MSNKVLLRNKNKIKGLKNLSYFLSSIGTKKVNDLAHCLLLPEILQTINIDWVTNEVDNNEN